MKVVTMTMRLASVKRHGNLATIALVVLTLVTAGLVGLGWSSPSVSVGHSTLVSHSSGAVPLAARQASVGPSAGEVGATVAITNTVQPYEVLPWALTWTVTVVNGTISTSNTWMSVSVNDITGSGHCVQNHNCPLVANLSANGTWGSGTPYTTTITTALLTAGGYNGGVLPSDQFLVNVWVTINNGVNNATFGGTREAFLVSVLPQGSFVAPLSGGALSTGNITIGVNYSGSYINGASVTIYQGTDTTGKIVYSQGVFVPGTGLHVVIANTIWYVPVAGSYYAVLNLSAPYGVTLFHTTLTVVPAGSTIYQNYSSWHNSSLPYGLSGQVYGSALLVIGLLVGAVLALALGRAVWGGTKPAPAQAWQAKPATNECSVCHQTFATDAELKEHTKSAHGM